MLGSALPAAGAAPAGTIEYRGEATSCDVLRRGKGGAWISANELAEAVGGRLIESRQRPGRYDLVVPARGKPKTVVRFQRNKSGLMVNWVLHFTKDSPIVHDDNVFVSTEFARTLASKALKERSVWRAKTSTFVIGTRGQSSRPRATAPAVSAGSRPTRAAPRPGVLRGLSEWWRQRIATSHRAALGESTQVNVVCLDAGHGGVDGGAVGPTGYREKDATLAVARRAADRLRERLPSVRVVLTRSDDRYVPLPERARIANRAGADLFVSIHMNSSRSRHAHGTEVYRWSPKALGSELERMENQGAPPDDAGEGLARILDQLEVATKDRLSVEIGGLVKTALVDTDDAQLEDRHDAILGGRFYVLAATRMPAVLVEVAFISNRREEKLLRTEAFQDEAADAIVRAIASFKQSVEGKQPYLVEAPGPPAPEGVSGSAAADESGSGG